MVRAVVMLVGWLLFRDFFRGDSDALWARRFFAVFLALEAVVWVGVMVAVALMVVHHQA